MNKAEFLRLHAECVTAMRAYFVEADVTTGCWRNAPQSHSRSLNA